MVEGATPLFWTLVRHRGGGAGAPVSSHHLPFPLGLPTICQEVGVRARRVAPSTVIPAGRLSGQPRSRLRKTADHKWPSGRERHAWGYTQPDISDPQHGQLATPLDGLGLRVDTRLTCPSVTVRSSRGLDLLRVCPLCRPSNRRSVPLPPPSGLGAESGDETRGVGTIWSVRQPCRGVSRLASTLGWPVRGVVQPPRWWLSGDTDAIWLDRCGEDADRPLFHGLPEQLRPSRSWSVQWVPFQKEGYNEGTVAGLSVVSLL